LNRGRSVFIRTPNNKTILVGGGQNSEAIREITKVMPFYKRKIDYVIIPGAVPAQIGGLIEIVERYEIEEIIMPSLMATSTVLSELKKVIKKNKIHIKEVERGDEIKVGEVSIKILFPYEGFKYNKTSLPELGIELNYKNTGVFLIGNLSKTIQKDIAKSFEIKTEENIVEYYNSASKTKVSDELLEKIKPKFTFSTNEKTMYLISDGDGWAKK
jgi:beta-lactamase superfamily II metal-dependent hydrolase